VQETRQSRNVVGVRVRDADCSESPEAPPGLTPGNLRALAAIEKRQMPVDPNEKAGQPAVRQRQHPTRSQEHGVDHSGRAGTSEEAMAQA
jgi:hypothetical protein